jgi:hypothetical protein
MGENINGIERILKKNFTDMQCFVALENLLLMEMKLVG